MVKELTGQDVPILIDPTLLLEAGDWDELVGDRLIDKDYLFFYTLFASKEMIDMVKVVSKKLNLPVVISNISNQYEIFSGFEKIRDAGPRDFLSLIKYAKFVCVTSFHGTVFSLLFNKPFYALNGLNDNRINTLLKTTGLTNRAVNIEDISKKIDFAYDEIDYYNVKKSICGQKELALEYFKEALNKEGLS